MKFWFGLLAGLAAGAVGGYFAAKKKFDKQLKESAEKLEAQYQDRLKRELSDADKKAEEHEKQSVVEALKKVEDEDAHVNDGVDVIALADEEEDEEDDLIIPDWDPGNGSEFDDPDEEWAEYLDSVSEYVGTARPYNITETMFSETKVHYQKRKLYLCVDEDQDYAYDADTGNIVEGYHLLIGDEEYDTLIPQRCDNAAWYVRNDREETDFMIQYQNSALLH